MSAKLNILNKYSNIIVKKTNRLHHVEILFIK